MTPPPKWSSPNGQPGGKKSNLRQARRRASDAKNEDPKKNDDAPNKEEKNADKRPGNASERDPEAPSPDNLEHVPPKTPSEDQTKIPLFAALVLPATGVNAERLIERGSDGEYAKFVAMGCLVIATAMFAFAGAGFFFSELIPSEWGLPRLIPILLLAALWSYVIYNIDRMFLSSMLGRSGVDKIIAGLIRLGLAVMLGIVISHPLKLLGVGQEIDIMIRILALGEDEVASTRLGPNIAELYAERETLIESRRLLGATNDDGITPDEIAAGIVAGTLLKEVETNQASLAEWVRGRDPLRPFIQLRFPYSNAIFEIVPTGSVAGCGRFESSLLDRWNELYFQIEASEQSGAIDSVVEANNERIRNFGVAAGFIIEDWGNIFQGAQPNLAAFRLAEIEREFAIGSDEYEDQLVGGAIIQNCSAGHLVERVWTTLGDRRDDLRNIDETTRIALEDIDSRIVAVEERLSILNEQQEIRREIVGILRESSYPYRTVIFNELSNPDGLDDEASLAFVNDFDLQNFFLFDRETRETFRTYNFAIILIFIFIEIMPVLMKLLAGMGKYERSVHAGESEESRMQDLAELARIKRQLKYEAALDMLQKRQALRDKFLE